MQETHLPTSFFEYLQRLRIISVCNFNSKVLILKLWITRLNLDEYVEEQEQVNGEWRQFREVLTILRTLRIPWWLSHGRSTQGVELRSFSGASADAYAAVIYMKTINADGIRDEADWPRIPRPYSIKDKEIGATRALGQIASDQVGVGRVLETHPRKDGLVRVDSLQTAGGVIKRPLVKLALLPVAPLDLDGGQLRENV
ncbi:hypothetical protein LAZ67_2001334 [Cordylochernes scorpioides]|uniref:DUF5641 domain-containing protein n=1 Tax=Cordylochernes scorpioides TaxID=51811 RepID=A0ABY6K2T2_9ARAC|nr:hypothetical protein LAZ67_2001334 [Cordylochernes scorpioides]